MSDVVILGKRGSVMSARNRAFSSLRLPSGRLVTVLSRDVHERALAKANANVGEAVKSLVREVEIELAKQSKR